MRERNVIWIAAALLGAVLRLNSAPASSTNAAGPAVVTVVSDPAATSAFVPDQVVVERLVKRGLLDFTGKPSLDKAWRVYIAPKDVVGFKVTAGPGELSGTRPAVVEALVGTLIGAGHDPKKIVIWDRQLTDLQRSGFEKIADRYGVRLAGTVDTGWEKTKIYESSIYGKLAYGDLEFGTTDKDPTAGRRSHVSKLITQELTKIVTVAPLLSHNVGGVNGHLVGLALASVDNSYRFQGDTNIISEAVPEICALDDIWQKVAFGVSDALVCQFRGEEHTLLHYAVALNELRFSTDLVALDVLSLADIERSRAGGLLPGERPFYTSLFRNAALIELGMDDPKQIQMKRY